MNFECETGSPELPSDGPIQASSSLRKAHMFSAEQKKEGDIIHLTARTNRSATSEAGLLVAR